MQSLDFKQLFERLPSPHMVLDRELRIVYANGAYERVTMRSRGDLIGKRLFDLFPNEDEGGRKLRASFERVFQTGETDTLPYLAYDIPRPEENGGGLEERYWTAVHVPLSIGSTEVTHLLQNTVDVTEIARIRQAASMPFRAYPGETQLIERAREAEEVQQSLLERSEDFRRVFQQAPGFIAVLMGREHRFTFANDAYRRLIGGRSVVGLKVLEALPEIEDQGFLEILDRVYTTGVAYSGEAARIMLQRAPGEAPRESFIDFSYEAIKDADGSISGILVQGSDRTEAVRTQRRQRLLLDELNHRVKNTLATVQSIASQTLRSARDLPSAKKDFEARIIALSKAHNMLSAREWSDTELSALIRQELSAYGRERMTVGGPSVVLNPKASIAFAMLVHELSTNAAKYGALSTPGGRVDVSWWLDEGGLELEWRESGGPVVSAPTRQGFGTRMIERVVTGELGGDYRSSYDGGGFSCRLTVPATAYAKVQDALIEPAR